MLVWVILYLWLWISLIWGKIGTFKTIISLNEFESLSTQVVVLNKKTCLKRNIELYGSNTHEFNKDKIMF